MQKIKSTIHRQKTKNRNDGGGAKKRGKRGKKSAGEGDDSESSEENEDTRREARAHRRLNSLVRCYDGFNMSVQASAERLCTPKDDQGPGPYTHVEVG